MDLRSPCPGGGMAYAEDLKSFVLNGTCGFDPHPGHFIPDTYVSEFSNTVRRVAFGELLLWELVFQFAG
jgi:hypothetical protein